jgi:pimeloyl-ACP methyl ester carboxylesterase
MLCLLATEVALDGAKRSETDDMLSELRRRLNSNTMRTQCVLQRLRLLAIIAGLLESLSSYVDAARDFLIDIESTPNPGPDSDRDIADFIKSTKAAATETLQLQTRLETKPIGQQDHHFYDEASHEVTLATLSLKDSFPSHAFHSHSMNTEVARKLRDPLGLTTIYDPGTTASSHIIFVHGLSGGSESTWIMGDSITQFWPKYWLPQEPEFRDVRIHSFGYNSGLKTQSAPNFKDAATSLLLAILDSPFIAPTPWNGGSTPLIFVGHSLGGLVIKQACVISHQNPKFRQVADRISAVIFLGTPHRDAETAPMLSRILTLAGASSTVVTDLLLQSPDLQRINITFKHHAAKLSLFSYQETRPVYYGIHHGIIVDKPHAVMNLTNELCDSMDAGHLDIARYASRQDPSYKQIKNVLATYLNIQRHQISAIVDDDHPRLLEAASSN